MIAAKEGETEDGTPPRRFLARAKSNIGPDEGGFAYELRQEPMPGDDRIIASIAVFGEAIEGSARDMLAAAEAEPSEDKGAFGEAEDFLKEQLADGPVPTTELKAAATAHAIAWRTVETRKEGDRRRGVQARQQMVLAAKTARPRPAEVAVLDLTPQTTPTSNFLAVLRS